MFLCNFYCFILSTMGNFSVNIVINDLFYLANFNTIFKFLWGFLNFYLTFYHSRKISDYSALSRIILLLKEIFYVTEVNFVLLFLNIEGLLLNFKMQLLLCFSRLHGDFLTFEKKKKNCIKFLSYGSKFGVARLFNCSDI